MAYRLGFNHAISKELDHRSAHVGSPILGPELLELADLLTRVIFRADIQRCRDVCCQVAAVMRCSVGYELILQDPGIFKGMGS